MSILVPPFELGRLNREPITPVGGSAHPVVRGRIHLPVRAGSVDGYIKLLPRQAFCVESVCAWLAREVNLPMPEVFWVTVHRNRMRGLWPFGDDDAQWCFGTAALPFAQAVRLDSQSPAALSSMYGLDSLMLAKIALFDELIGNDDRHDGNLLLTTHKTIALIDHERALGGAGLELFSSFPPPGPNRLLERVRVLPLTDRAVLKVPLRSFCIACSAAVLRLPYGQLVSDDALHEPMRRYLEQRANRLINTLDHVLGIPDLPGVNPPGLQPPAL
ncbi:HipA family kinase [Trinickia dinghuensis]|uniref:HipA-like kinase domain-containing protein n=1 Tax=Trinickia dinghuensis TaxID=2291023 RepID=A0A3D8K129_9BURK|nr:HipA family kinase [Trinickia dinghuensis]RDU98949.1 hypothetical protein DWV00_11960 [Trinickia dinghuensis]